MSNIKIGPQGDEDRARRETFDGIPFHFKASDPYGFWKITCLKTNKNLPGQFTSINEAYKAAQFHAIDLNKNKKEA